MPKLPSLRLLLVLGALSLAACEPAERAPKAASVRAQQAAGRAAAQRWIAGARAGQPLGEEQAVALGYLERLRLGIGGPFRLIDQAVHDPRLSDTVRTRLGWALLGRTASGVGYQVDPAVLDRAGEPIGSTWPFLGPEHVGLIGDAIREATDARAGELAVRLGYALAAAEGTLGPQAPRIAARVAALLRDRELARADARMVLDRAGVTGADPLALVVRWRAERRFRSEAPFLAPLAGDLERQALELAPRLAAGLRELSVRGRVSPRREPVLAVRASLLTPAAARRLLDSADSLAMPPLAPIAIAVRGYGSELADGVSSDSAKAVRRALAAATTEEELVARYALLGQRNRYDVAPSLAVLWAATGIRTLAQEPVWYPGYGGPSARELEQRFGLASVRFSESVPAEWRPYYRGMLHAAITDLQRVLPALDVSGLRVRFDARARQSGTLALHDPQKRTLILPVASAAGTIAHEIAHDLDWQVALRRYRVRGDYASDRATRTAASRARDPLALRLQDLYAGVPLPPGTSERLQQHARRPAEVFARNIDWFVAVSLAGSGRMNGYLTSVQDELLTGYGTVRPPELTGAAGDALMRILDVVAPVYPETRTWFLRYYGSGRDLRSYDLARRVLETELPAARDEPFAPNRWQGSARNEGSFARIARARDGSIGAVDAWTCRAPQGARDARLEAARRRLVVAAAAARARGVALDRARVLSDDDAELMLVRELYGQPVGNAELAPETEEFVRQLAEGVRRMGEGEGPELASGFTLLASGPSAECAPAR